MSVILGEVVVVDVVVVGERERRRGCDGLNRLNEAR